MNIGALAVRSKNVDTFKVKPDRSTECRIRALPQSIQHWISVKSGVMELGAINSYVEIGMVEHRNQNISMRMDLDGLNEAMRILLQQCPCLGLS